MDGLSIRRHGDQTMPNMMSDWKKFAPGPRPLSGDDQYNVFLSYRSVNRRWVLNLYDVLHELGHKVFLDQYELKAGDQLSRRLEDALTRSQAGVLVWTHATADSEWVRREYDVLERLATEKRDFQFVPVRLDASRLPPWASNRVFLDFSSYPDGPNGGELLRLLHALAGKALSPEAARFAVEQDLIAKATAAEIDATIMNRQPDDLIALFEAGGLAWETTAALGCKAAEGLTKLKRNDDAIVMLEKMEKRFPAAIRRIQLHALALARRGGDEDLRKAQKLVGGLYARGERDPETVGIYARTWMDRYAKSKDQSELLQSRDLYAEAFEKAPDDSYTGINAASKSVLIGTTADIARGRQYAERVQRIVGTKKEPNDYWKTATVGEVYLLQENYAEAGRLYGEAVALARSETASHESTWLQASRLMEKLKPTPEQRALVRAAFAHLPEPPPSV